MHTSLSSDTIAAIVSGRHADPFSILGVHDVDGATVVRAFVPGAATIDVVTRDGNLLGHLDRRHDDGFFEGAIASPPGYRSGHHLGYRLQAANRLGKWIVDDAYAYGPVLGAIDDWLIGEGTHVNLYDRLGAHLIEHETVAGVHFAVWAPNAQRVSVVGDFNAWDGRAHAMRKRVGTGVWEIFIPALNDGAIYKYEVIGADGTLLPLKADPVGFGAELRPSTASVVRDIGAFDWHDSAWMSARATRDPRRTPMSIYEVHLGSWRRGEHGRWLTYDELADALVPYASEMGFTHIELMPISEYPLDDSWGYQPIGLFAPTSRYGEPAAFARFVDRCHQAGIGVILDWVAGHFPTDAHGLSHFDGTALYEHADPRQGFHPDWNTAIFNFGRKEVANYLIASALFWLDRYHIDGLRVDAVASMLYLDYSREDGKWLPNRYGGNENLEAVAFIRKLNETVYARHPGVVTVAEESTAWPAVSAPTHVGGLGFGFKWDMGWMHDTLEYLKVPPSDRRWHHNLMTFGLMYAFAENFVLPISHDEVVHGKGSLLARIPGDAWQQFATLRAYFACMWAHPGKKLLFMGQEFAQGREWSFGSSLDWHLLDIDWHRGVRAMIRDANRAYSSHPALYQRDCEGEGFRWIDVDNSAVSIFSWLRFAGPWAERADDGQGAGAIAVVANFQPVARENYVLRLPAGGTWREILNTDAAAYGGSNRGNAGRIETSGAGAGDSPYAATITVPPLATLWFVHDSRT